MPRPTRTCAICSGSMVGRSSSAKTCSDACRQALSRAKKAARHSAYVAKVAERIPGRVDEPVIRDVPKPPPSLEDPTPRLPRGSRNPSNDLPAIDPNDYSGKLTRTTINSFERMGIHDWEDDPLAVNIIVIAQSLDAKQSLPPGSISQLTKAFRESFQAYKDARNRTVQRDPVAAAKSEAESILAGLGAPT